MLELVPVGPRSHPVQTPDIKQLSQLINLSCTRVYTPRMVTAIKSCQNMAGPQHRPRKANRLGNDIRLCCRLLFKFSQERSMQVVQNLPRTGPSITKSML